MGDVKIPAAAGDGSVNALPLAGQLFTWERPNRG
jgi:hypothetical protein